MRARRRGSGAAPGPARTRGRTSRGVTDAWLDGARDVHRRQRRHERTRVVRLEVVDREGRHCLERAERILGQDVIAVQRGGRRHRRRARWGWRPAAGARSPRAAAPAPNSAESKRGSSRISSTSAMVESQLRASVLPRMLNDSRPADTLIDAPSRSMACSSSAGGAPRGALGHRLGEQVGDPHAPARFGELPAADAQLELHERRLAILDAEHAHAVVERALPHGGRAQRRAPGRRAAPPSGRSPRACARSSRDR